MFSFRSKREMQVARIGKSEHARILRLADVEGRKVAEIAAEYGCTAANIYALLGKLRRAPAPALEAPVPQPVAAEPAPDASVVDLFALPAPPVRTEAAPLPARLVPTAVPPATPRQVRAEKPVTPVTVRPALKQGYGLVMRSPDGEESVAPFRSLDDLLGAIKPILRAAATGSEPAWFCIKPVDLAALEEDAA